MNHELPDVPAGFRKGRGTRDQICQHLLDHRKSKRVPEKHLFLLYWLHQSLWLCGSQQTVENSLRNGSTRPPYLPPEKSVCRSRGNKQLEPDMEQWTGSKLEKAVYCHPSYLTYMQITSCEMLGWMKHKPKWRLPGEISTISDMQMTPPVRKWRGTKEPLDESETGEWKSWLKTQYSKN